MAEVIIIDVTLNSQDATKKANDLGKSIKEIKAEQKDLKSQGKDLDASYISNAQAIRQLSAEQKAYVTIAATADGSNNQLRGQLALLTQQYNALGKAERDNTTAGKALQIQIKGISDELKVNESAVGDNRRNVGNYKDAIVSANEAVADQKTQLSGLGGVVDKAPIGFKLLGDQIGNVKNQLNNFRQAQGEARATQEAFSEAQQIATQATLASEAATQKATAIGFKFAAGEATAAQAEAARAAATDAATVATAAQTSATEAQTVATAAGTNAAKVFKIALASTGIGAIIILVAALASYLSKFDPILDKVEQGFAAVGAVIDTVGRFVVSFVQNLKSVGDLMSKIGGFLAHPIDSFKELGAAIEVAAVAAVALKKAQQDLEDQQKIQEITNAKAIQQIQQLTLQARNRALSERERQALLKEAAKIDQDNFNQRTKLVNEERRQAQESIAITAGLNAKELKMLDEKGLAYAFELKDRVAVSDEQVDALKKAELDKTAILTESTNRQEKLQNLSDALAEKAAAAEEKRQAKLKALREKAQAAETERLNSVLRTNEGVLAARLQEINSINTDIDEKITKYKKYGATTEQLERERTARLLKVTKEYYTRDKATAEENQKQIEDLIISTIKDQGVKKLAQLDVNNKRELAENDKQLMTLAARSATGEKGLSDLYQTTSDKRLAIQTAYTFARQEAIDAEYKIELDAFNQHQIDLATAQVANAQTDADKLLASQALLDAQYQQQIDAANLAGADTTAINAQYEAQRREQAKATNDAALNGVKEFGKGFQGILKENTIAYKIAAAVQAKIDAAQALRNNILIIQENIKALTSQGKLPFPLNIVAIASTLTALVGAVAAAKTIVQPVALATGGVFDSGGRGGLLPGYSKKDNTNAFLRSGEAVIVSEATQDPKALAALNAINVAYGGAPLAPGIAMASGGIAQGGFVSDITRDALGTSDLINLVVAGVSAAPRPIVDVRTITTAQQTNQIEVANRNL